jgi:hypothetical protein
MIPRLTGEVERAAVQTLRHIIPADSDRRVILIKQFYFSQPLLYGGSLRPETYSGR